MARIISMKQILMNWKYTNFPIYTSQVTMYLTGVLVYLADVPYLLEHGDVLNVFLELFVAEWLALATIVREFPGSNLAKNIYWNMKDISS